MNKPQPPYVTSIIALHNIRSLFYLLFILIFSYFLLILLFSRRIRLFSCIVVWDDRRFHRRYPAPPCLPASDAANNGRRSGMPNRLPKQSRTKRYNHSARTDNSRSVPAYALKSLLQMTREGFAPAIEYED